jgi:hypothetical protein
MNEKRINSPLDMCLEITCRGPVWPPSAQVETGNSREADQVSRNTAIDLQQRQEQAGIMAAPRLHSSIAGRWGCTCLRKSRSTIYTSQFRSIATQNVKSTGARTRRQAIGIALAAMAAGSWLYSSVSPFWIHAIGCPVMMLILVNN